MQLLALTLLSTLFLASSIIQGPTEYVAPSTAADIALSLDQQVLMAIYQTENVIRVFQNNGLTFQLSQTFAAPVSVTEEIDLNGDGSMFAFSAETDLLIYELVNGTYQSLQNLTIANNITSIEISRDSQFITVGAKLGTVEIYERQVGNIYTFFQDLSAPNGDQEALFMSDDNMKVMIGDLNGFVRIHDYSGAAFTLSQSFTLSDRVRTVKVVGENLMVSGEKLIHFYEWDGSQYAFATTFDDGQTVLKRIGVSNDFKKLIYGGAKKDVNIREINGVGSYDSLILDSIAGNIEASITDEIGLYYIVTSKDNKIRIYFECPSECTTCSFPNSCSACEPGYSLIGGLCTQANQTNTTNTVNATDTTNQTINQNQTVNGTNSTANQTTAKQKKEFTICVGNKFLRNGLCQQYCSRKCKTCNQTKDDCIKCAYPYSMNKKGQCVVKNEAIKVIKDMRPFLNLIRKRGLKFIFFMVDDLWLYQYHKRKYDGIMKKVFQTISFLEEKQWEIVGLDGALESVLKQMKEIPKYNQFSNKRYMEQARKNNYMMSSLLEYLLLCVPFTFLCVLIFNKIFYTIFDYPVSIWLRPFAFWLILLDLLIQSNIEYFTFLGFRSMETMMSFTFVSKFQNGFFIIFMFVVFITVCSSYVVYLSRYGKLARYFLSNLYRFPACYVLMMILYGFRPFLKGLIHAIFYDEWVLQMYLLSAVEVMVVIIVLVYEIVLECHKSKFIMIVEGAYSTCIVTMNTLLLLKHEYLDDEGLKGDIQVMLELLVILMVMLLVMRFFLEIKAAVDCSCQRVSPAAVVPENGNILDENNNGKSIEDKNGNKIVVFDFRGGTIEVPAERNQTLDYFNKKHEDYKNEKAKEKEKAEREKKKKEEKERKQKQRKQKQKQKQKQKGKNGSRWLGWTFRLGNKEVEKKEKEQWEEIMKERKKKKEKEKEKEEEKVGKNDMRKSSMKKGPKTEKIIKQDKKFK